MASCLSFLTNMLTQIYNITLPWGITFGAVLVGVFGIPLLFQAFRKFF